MGPEPEQPVLSYLNDPLRAGIETDHQRPGQFLHGGATSSTPGTSVERCSSPHRDWRDRSRSDLRRPRHPDQNDIGFLQTLEMLAIIMQHRVVECVDTLEVFGIERVLRANAVRSFGTEIGSQQLQNRAEDRQAGQAELSAAILEPLGQLLVQQRIEYEAR